MKRPTAKAFIAEAEKINDQAGRLLSSPEAAGFVKWLEGRYVRCRIGHEATDRESWIALGRREVALDIIRAFEALNKKAEE